MEDTRILNFTLNDNSKFKTYLESLSKINDSKPKTKTYFVPLSKINEDMKITIECRLKNDIPQIIISSLDQNKTNMTYLIFGSHDFTNFYIKNPLYTLKLQFMGINQMSKLLNENDEVTFYVTENEKNILYVDIKNAYCNVKYTIPIELSDAIFLPKLDFKSDAVITIDTFVWNKLCEIMRRFSENVNIKCTNEYIEIKPEIMHSFTDNVNIRCTNGYVETKPEITESVGMKFYASENTKIVLQNKNNTDIITCTIEIDKIIAFSNMEKYNRNVRIYMSKDFPFALKYDLDKQTTITNCILSSYYYPNDI